jgi:cytoskeletal protein RodZ
MQDVNARDMASLGTTFLSLAYLMVNQDANQFTLWAANPTTHSSDLVAVDEDGADVTATCTATSSATADSTSSSTSSNDDDESPSPSASGDGTSSDAGESTSTGRAATEATTAPTLSKGGIAGVVVGGVAAVALMGAAAFWLLRRKRAAAAAAAAAAVPAVWDQHHPTSEMYVPPKYTHEIEGTPYSAEMPANPAMYNPPGVRYEMA